MTRDLRHPRLTRGLVALMSVGAGVSAAATYYVQPLLDTVGRYFAVMPGVVGLVATLAYTLGLALIVPLGDKIDRRRLVLVLAALSTLGLTGMALSPNIETLIAIALIVGVSTVTAQVFVPFAAQLASDDDRGRAVGRVMSGLLIGILLARTFSGLIAQVASWRVVFVAAAVLAATLGVACYLRLPHSRPTSTSTYRGLLTSTVRIFVQEPTLRRRGLYGGLVFASFSTFWTVVSLRLTAHYHYTEAVIGLFGLLGVAGAVCAQFAGRFADAGWARVATVGFIGLAGVSWVAIWVGGSSLVALIVGIVALDLGVQGTHISNQSEVYRLRPDARSRLTTGYMCSYFSGGLVGTVLAGVCYSRFGWTGVCLLGAGYSLLALAFWFSEASWPLSRMRHRRALKAVRTPSDPGCPLSS